MANSYYISRAYARAYLAFALIASLPSIFLIYIGLMTSSLEKLVFWGAVLLVVWVLLFCIKADWKVALWLSLISATVIWILLLNQTMRRIAFIIENDGMERADGYGSPMAFLIGLVGEQIFFIPLCFVFATGWINVISKLMQFLRRTTSTQQN